MWQDWQLRPSSVELAVLPLLIVHLLGQRANHLAIGTERLGDQRMTGRAECRCTDVGRLGLHEAGNRVHDRLRPASTASGPKIPRACRRPARRSDEIAVEAVPRPQPIGGNLMADRAADAVAGQRVDPPAGGFRNRQVREDSGLASASRGPSSAPLECGRWRTRPRYPRRATSGPSSRAGCWRARTGRGRRSPSSCARHEAPIETSSPLEVTDCCGRRRIRWTARTSAPPAGWWPACAEPRRRWRGVDRRQQDCAQPARRRDEESTHHGGHFQNSKKPPSNQSQSR